jgi:hypothetical protein
MVFPFTAVVDRVLVISVLVINTEAESGGSLDTGITPRVACQGGKQCGQ